MTKVAIQGIRASFHEMAALKYFGDEIEVAECLTFKMLCEKVDKGDVDYGIMAIENSLAGSILQNYSLIENHELKVIGEVYLHITMNLMALPGTRLEDVTSVHSHPIAIRQCADYLWKMEGVQLVDCDDTAASAKNIAENKLVNVAAVANEAAAKTYGLEILDKSIETHKRNYTRFLVLSKRASKKDTDNKASLCFQLGHQPGSLADVLFTFKDCGINLTKIQSVPIVGKPYEYSFYCDIEWSNRSDYNDALITVLHQVNNLSVLGEYKKSTWEETKFNQA